MDKKRIITILAVFIIVPCCCIVPFSFLVTSPAVSRQLNDLFSSEAFLLTGCCGFFLFMMALMVWMISNVFRSQKAATQLAEVMGLAPLNQAEKPVMIWSGGEVQGYRFGIKSVGFVSSYYFEGKSRRSVSYYLRIVLALNVSNPLGVVAYRSHKDGGKLDSFEEAFPTLENGSKLSSTAQGAMLDFIKKGYLTGFRKGGSVRFSPGIRNLCLRDRADAPEGLLADDVFGETAVILVHDHPNAISVTPDQLQTLLTEMVEVAKTIER